MAVKRRSVPNRGYGLDNALQDLAPQPIVSQRAPTANDVAEIGVQWIDVPNDAVYQLTSVSAGVANWATAPSSGATTLASLLVTPGDLDVDTGDATIAGTLDVTGVTTLGQLTSTSAAQLSLASSQDAADAILINASAGGIDITAAGAAGEDIDIVNTAGSVNIDGGEAIANAITLVSAAGGIDVDAALQINIASTQAAADAVRILASDAAGGIDIDDGGGGITIDSSDAISIDAAAASNFTITGAGDLTLAAGTSSVNVTGAEADAAAVLVSATNAAGGITLDSGATPGVTFTNGTQSHQMLVGSGSPNGSVTAAQGSLYIDVGGSTSTTILFCNTDGGTTWLGVGA